MIHRREISKAAARDRVPEKSVEKDYAMHWLMAGLARTSVHARLAFKGGTALRLCRFEGYRYSEDIDLTAVEEVDKAAAFTAFRDAGAWVREASAVQLEVVQDSHESHSDGFSFEVRYTGPLGGDAGSRSIKVDLSTSERVLFPIEALPLMPHYADLPVDARIRVYALEEVVVEKFRCLLNPARREPRDVYDLRSVALGGKGAGAGGGAGRGVPGQGGLQEARSGDAACHPGEEGEGALIALEEPPFPSGGGSPAIRGGVPHRPARSEEAPSLKPRGMP